MRNRPILLVLGCALALGGCTARYSFREAYAPPAKVIIVKKSPTKVVKVVEVVKVKKRKHGHSNGRAYKDFRD